MPSTEERKALRRKIKYKRAKVRRTVLLDASFASGRAHMMLEKRLQRANERIHELEQYNERLKNTIIRMTAEKNNPNA